MGDVAIMNRNMPHSREFPMAEVLDHVSLLQFFAKWIRPEIYVEYGIRGGVSFTKVSPLCKQAIGVDIEDCSTGIAPPHRFFQMKTRDFGARILPTLPRKVDMAFIDADHDAVAVFEDFQDLFPYVNEDGFIFLHDTYPTVPLFAHAPFCYDAWRARYRIQEKYGSLIEILTIPICPGLTIVRKLPATKAFWMDPYIADASAATHMNFDWQLYLEAHPDLGFAGIHTMESAMMHYWEYGYWEQRLASVHPVPPHKFTLPLDFTLSKYIAFNPDLSHLSTFAQGLYHYLNAGRPAGRLYAPPKKFYFSMFMMFQNEASVLKEWIEYHKLIGAEHFYLFDHDSTDESREILKPYVASGLVTLTPCRGKWHDIVGNVWEQGLKLARGQTQWLGVVDSDEFLVPKSCRTMQEFLPAYESYGAVGVNWQTFGTSNIDKVDPKTHTMVEKLTWKADALYWENKGYKSILQVDFTRSFRYQHEGEFCPGYPSVDSAFIPKSGSPDRTWNISRSVHKIQVNHYITRDRHFFLHVKVPRRKFTFKEEAPALIAREREYHVLQDKAILRYVPDLRRALGIIDE